METQTTQTLEQITTGIPEIEEQSRHTTLDLYTWRLNNSGNPKKYEY